MRYFKHVLEFRMVHDPETSTVRLSMVALADDDQVVRFEGEGTYHRSQDEPRAELSVQSEPVEAPFGDVFRHYWPETPTATSKCTVGELRVTKPIVRTIVPQPVPSDEAFDLEDPELADG